MQKYVLEVNNLSKSYIQGGEQLEILKNLNISIKSGEIIGITGPSGCGKSTLLHVCGLLDRPDAGEIIIDGQNINGLNDKELGLLRKNKLSFIYQFHYLMTDFTIWENLELIMKLRDNISFDQNMILELLKAFEIEDKINSYPGELSGGQQQRVAIIRALLDYPAIIMADEPTGNLDPLTAKKVMEIFYNQCKKYNIAALIVTHNQEITSFFDKVYKMHNHQLVEA